MDIEELKELLNKMDIFEIWDYIIDPANYGQLDELDSEFGEKLMLEKMNLDELILNPKLFEEEYEGVLEYFIEQGDINTIIKLLKVIDNPDKLLGTIKFNYSVEDIEQLSEEDRYLFIDKLGPYLPISIQEKFIGRSREELINDKKIVIPKLRQSQIEKTLEGLAEDELLKLANELDIDVAIKIMGILSEENRLEVIKARLEELDGDSIRDLVWEMNEENNIVEVIRLSWGKLDGYAIENLAEGLEEEKRLEVIRIALKKLNAHNIMHLAEGMDEKNLASVIEMTLSSERLSVMDILLLTHENVEMLIEIFAEKDAEKYFDELIKRSNHAQKLRSAKLYAEKIPGKYVNKLIEGMEQKDKLKIKKLQVGLKNLEGENLYTLIASLRSHLGLSELNWSEIGNETYNPVEGIDEENIKKLISIVSFIDINGIATICKGKSKLEVIEKYKESLGKDGIVQLLKEMSEENRIKGIVAGLDQLDGDGILKIAEGMGAENRLRVIELSNEKIGKDEIRSLAGDTQYIPELSDVLLEYLPDIPLSEKVIELFKTGKIMFKTATIITTENELKFCEIYGDLYDADKTGINTISSEKIEKLNKKHIRPFMKLLEEKGIDSGGSLSIALNMYCTVGFNRGKEILEGKYGEIRDVGVLERIFKNINLSEFIFDSQGMPQVNEEFLNLAFGQNYKVNEDASPFKFYLKKNFLDERHKDVKKFFDKFGVIYSEWDRINEEIDRKKAISKIEVKRNVESVVNVLGIINDQEFIPETLTDYKLAKTDITQYAGKDTQYTVRPEEALDRARYLSKLQEECKTKKFPNVRVEDFDEEIVCTTYNPQDRGIITAGYKSGCCFRPNGNADGSGRDNESLMKYCLTSEYAGGIRIEIPNKETGELDFVMFSPILRNGNMLMIHSVETQETSPEIIKKINKVLEQYANEVLRQSKEAEGKDGIQAVLITDLHSDRFDTNKSNGILGERFTLHSDAPSEMYTNLTTTTHHVIAKNDGITEGDLYKGDVDFSYEFPEMDSKVMMAYSKEECEFIREYEEKKKEIIRLANEKKGFLEEGKSQEADKCQVAIRSLQKEKSKLRKKCQNGIIALDNHRKQKAFMNGILNNVYGDKAIPIGDDIFSRIIIGEGYFIAVTENSEIIVESTNNGRQMMEGDLEKLKDFLGADKVKVVTYREYMENKERANESKSKNSVHALAYEGGGNYEH